MPELIDQIVDAALQAGKVIMEIYETDFDFEIKGDDSPVTKADQAAEAVILEILANIAPTIPVVAEEAVAAGNIPTVNGEFFLVDPLDGTKEFIQKNREFTVNIALIRDNVPILGVIYAPALGCLFAGEVGNGAWRGEVADSLVFKSITNRSDIMVRENGATIDVVGSRSHHSSETEIFLKDFSVGQQKSIGSSLKFCLLASGEADLYPRFGRTMEWDTAAGDAILTAAGGAVVTLDGKRLQYGKVVQDDAPFSNPYFIAKSSQD
ncbi:3'(2'),5'-bisphosphate nucleotidase CysQ [Cohaesibacter celericrescens]|uniref:3'(2'),5'-bisphosphate nucleotidase CysQ n=1 Tax=Cohaesibacter celericrescens TaxID=2067669 RepID=A0A2N5XJX3_9HYPH|nr:3'(2'),5'-bisphosphate nucleotidase CysQ [Cohaesibacter celericrescens]PLW74802.1 3'(2'),5'-bisphosphate nucleotidase [Cohaesibacter celericrescens]